MITSEKNIYIQETEIKPNKYAGIVLLCTLSIIITCWIVNELGIFRVGDMEMRIGSMITIIVTVVPLLMLYIDKNSLSNPKTKFLIIGSATVFTFTVGTLLTFHTTIMLLFPILFAMLYRSKALGIFATISSFSCTILTPITGYLLHTWDIPLFEELILIATNGGVVSVAGGQDAPTWINIGKILLYLVGPRLLIVGSVSVLMFYNIKLGVDHVNNQILLNKLSHVDSLTGLYNQNCYKEFIETEKFNAVTVKLGVVFMDVNGLKAINDSNGHELGDILLKRSAESVLAVCDNESIVGFRAGGDEFVIIMEQASEEKILVLIEKWENELRMINEENKDEFGGLVCSMACGYELGDSYNIYELIKTADARMYENKAKMKASK